MTVITSDAADLSALWDRRARRVRAGVPDEHQGVRIRRLPVRYLPWGRTVFPLLRRLTWLTSGALGRHVLPLSGLCPWMPQLSETLAVEPAELLFAWNITLEGLTARVWREAIRRDVPWVAIPLLHLGRDRFYTMRHQLALLRQAQCVLAQTDLERAFLLEQGFLPEQVKIVSPGVDLKGAEGASGTRFCRKHGLHGPLVVSLGALGLDKGTPQLLQAAQRLAEWGHNLTVVLIGPEQERVTQLLARLPERGRSACRALGVVSEDEKWDALDAASVVAMPSRTESFGIVFLEAWACGKPVIGARAGAVPDVVRHGVDGLLVEFGDTDGLAQALDDLLHDPARATEMGRRGRERVRAQYTWEQRYPAWQALVDGLT